MASVTYVSCEVLAARHKHHLTGPERGASEAVGTASSSPGSLQPARPSLRFSGMLAAAHTLTSVPRDLSQRLLFPDAPPHLRNECRGRNKSPAKACQFPPKSSRMTAGCAQGTGKVLVVPVLCCHQSHLGVTRDQPPHLTNADSSQSIPLGQASPESALQELIAMRTSHTPLQGQ